MEFELLNDPTTSISISDLLLRIQTMCSEFPEMRETMHAVGSADVYGSPGHTGTNYECSATN